MKASNKSSIITGVVLLLLAALFSISLLLQPLDFGIGGPGHDNFFYLIGKILFTVYGFSSLLIPLFLLVAGLSCFATKWTARKTMYLLTAIVPFFTCVITENICRSILALGNSHFTPVKIAVSLVTGIMLVAIEFLGTGILADKINNGEFNKSKKSDEDDDLYDEEYDEIMNDFEETSESNNLPETTTPDNNENSESAELSSENISSSEENSPSESDSTAATDIADENIPSSENDSPASDSESFTQADSTENNDISDENPASVITQEEYAALTVMDEPDEPVDELEWPDLPPKPETLPPEYDEDFDESDPALEFPPKDAEEDVVTEEKSAAEMETATNPVVNSDDENQSVAENTYKTDEEISDTEIGTNTEVTSSESVLENESTMLDDFIAEPENDVEETPVDEENENPFSDFEINVGDESELPDTTEEEIDFSDFEDENIKQEKPAIDENEIEEKDDPYATTRYIDSVVENPAFPHGITIHDEDETPVEETEEKKNPKLEKPKFPTRISLDDDLEQEIQAYEEAEEEDDFSVFDIETPAVKSIKLPESKSVSPAGYASQVIPVTPAEVADMQSAAVQPSANIPTSAQQLTATQSATRQQTATHQDISQYLDTDEPYDTEPAQDKSSYEPKQPESASYSSTVHPSVSYDESTNTHQAVEQENSEPSISSSVADVFSDMEADIRRKNGLPEKGAIVHSFEPEEVNTANDDFIEETFDDYDENDSIQAEEEANPNPIAPNTATNLTKDDLTDFFNAQTKENTPVTKEIEGNPPKTNRATKKGPYLIPSSLLTAYKGDEYWIIDDATKEAAMNLKQTLAEFSIEAKIIGIKKGPVVTMFEILPAPGVRLNRIVALQDNIALSLAAQSIRIVAPIPGKQAVGIEVPNRNRSIVGFREIIEMDLPEWNKMAVPVVLGKDILGKAQLIDLVKTPHMLIAGATGSGKSVCVNSLILSILYKRSFRDVKLILVDPKVVELKLYNNIPHLLTPVITEPKKALQALQYCLCEMERRYALLDSMGVRDISTYNQRIKEREIATEKLPYIVVIIDEFADLMATSGKELESIVARLTAMSRAVGIHLVLATQRPSVNVITGLIKANIPTRIAFMVASRTDSNIIIDSVGAEKLLGRGDMLFASAVDPAPVRIQGTFVNDNEVEDVVNAVKEYGEPDYIDDEIFVEDDDDVESLDLFGNQISDEDPLYDQALEIVVQAGKASASYIQRRLKIGYNRAARLVEEMEERGIVGPANGSKPREIIHMP